MDDKLCRECKHYFVVDSWGKRCRECVNGIDKPKWEAIEDDARPFFAGFDRSAGTTAR